MKHVLSVSFGELTLKGHNRRTFEDNAIKNLLKALRPWHFERLYREQGKIYIEADPTLFPEMIQAAKRVLGLYQFSPAVRTEKTMEAIGEAALAMIQTAQKERAIRTFKVDAHRTDKTFPFPSPKVNAEIGGVILENTDLQVDVHNPDTMVYIDIREHAYVYTEKIKGYAGLPVGSSGRGLLLLSGGIDSPVAGFLMARRGMRIDGLHFHSYPFTSERAEDKVLRLADILSGYIGPMHVTSVNLLNIQAAIREHAREREWTILQRRFMMRIADAIAKKYDYQALVTGESLGQVASQTVQSMQVIEKASDTLIVRPLVGMDKIEITRWANEIGTFETSIEPFEDCCTVFLPSRPLTKPHLADIEASEAKLDIETLVAEALEDAKRIPIGDTAR